MRAERRASMKSARFAALKPFIIMCGFLAARQQHRLDLGLSGARHFANQLTPRFELAGVGGDVAARILAACEQSADRMVDELLASDVPSAWTHMARTDGHLYSSIAT